MDIQFAEFLISALIAAESLLVSIFGNLYSVYATYMTTGAAPICRVLRWLCALLSLTVSLAAAIAIYTNHVLRIASVSIPEFVVWGVDLIVVLIPIPAIVITQRMFRDAAA